MVAYGYILNCRQDIHGQWKLLNKQHRGGSQIDYRRPDLEKEETPGTNSRQKAIR